jgi:hypothetical protein
MLFNAIKSLFNLEIRFRTPKLCEFILYLLEKRQRLYSNYRTSSRFYRLHFQFWYLPMYFEKEGFLLRYNFNDRGNLPNTTTFF